MTNNEKPAAAQARQSTLCYLLRGDSCLMLHRTKKKNDMNRDKWIAVGGGMEKGESPEDCMKREVFEETGLTVTEWRYRGFVTFVSDAYPDEYMHLFTCTAWTGNEIVCNEGDLEWVRLDRLASLPAWEGDRLFNELLINGAPPFSLKLVYGGEKLLYAELDGRPYPPNRTESL